MGTLVPKQLVIKETLACIENVHHFVSLVAWERDLCVCMGWCVAGMPLVARRNLSGPDCWATIAACPSLMCFFNRGNTEGSNSSKNLCLMFVYLFIIFYVGLCKDWIYGFGISCGFYDLRAEWIGDRLNIVFFGRDVILCGWLGSKYQLTDKSLLKVKQWAMTAMMSKTS